MCGILAILNYVHSSNIIKHQFLQQLRKLRHRGPDSSGLYLKNNNILGFERLAIIDINGGNQPLKSKDENIILVANGEIYNYKELKQEFNRNDFTSNSDCEIIINLYKNSSPQIFLNKLNGIFAFVLIDEKNNNFLIARDNIGVIPFYIGRDETDSIWISSELKALYQVCKHITEFPPGHFLENNKKGLISWYNPSFLNTIPTAPVDLKLLRETLESSVKKQLMTDVPFGVLLSGGLDSSLICSIVKKNIDEKQTLHTFSIGLKDSPDLKYAKIVSKYLNTIHHEFHFTIEEGINNLNDVIYHLETFDVTTIRAGTPMFLLARKIKSLGIKMVLSGEISDEIFGGYLYFHKAPNKEEFYNETVRKLKALHQYDLLRANKAMMAFGIELRVPFGDKDFLEVVMNIDPQEKMCNKNKMEKYILRKSFAKEYLPDEILWRQKEQFSDGVGYNWISSLKEYANNEIWDEKINQAKIKFPLNTPITKEAYLYREIFENNFTYRPDIISLIPSGPSIACSTSTDSSGIKIFLRLMTHQEKVY